MRSIQSLIISQDDTEEVKMIWKKYGRFYILEMKIRVNNKLKDTGERH